MCTLIKQGCLIRCWIKNIFYTKKVVSKIPRRSQAKEMKCFLPGPIPAACACICVIVHYYINQTSVQFCIAIFNRQEFVLIFMIQFWEDWPSIHTLCTSLGAAQGLCSQSVDGYTKLRSKVCTGQFADCPNLCTLCITYIL